MTVVSRIISFIFHPLLLATYLFATFSLVLPAGLAPLKEEGHRNFIFLIFCVTFLLPVLNVMIFKTIGTIRSFTMENQRERYVPFVFVTILYIAVTYLFYSRTRLSADDNLLKFMIIIDLLVLVATVVTFFYKVSVHAMAMWALVGILISLNNLSEDGALFYPTLIAIVVTGLVMSARLYLNSHTLREVVVGGVLGMFVGFGAMMVLF